MGRGEGALSVDCVRERMMVVRSIQFFISKSISTTGLNLLSALSSNLKPSSSSLKLRNLTWLWEDCHCQDVKNQQIPFWHYFTPDYHRQC